MLLLPDQRELRRCNGRRVEQGERYDGDRDEANLARPEEPRQDKDPDQRHDPPGATSAPSQAKLRTTRRVSVRAFGAESGGTAGRDTLRWRHGRVYTPPVQRVGRRRRGDPVVAPARAWRCGNLPV